MMTTPKELGREIPPDGATGSLYILGEAPGQNEDRMGKAFVGSSGNLLWRVLRMFYVDRSQCRVANVFWRRPPNNNIEIIKKLPEFKEYCQKTIQDILSSKPKAVLLLGKTALECLFGDTYQISSIRGYWLDFQGIPCMPTWHPSAVLRNYSYYLSFANDVRKVVNRVFKPELCFAELKVQIYENDQDKFCELAELALQEQYYYALDIEVSQGDLWQCDLVGIAYKIGDTYYSANSFPTQKVLSALRELSEKASGLAVFHNASFDLTWLYGEFGIEWSKAPRDTMIMHHILLPDQPKSLEFCASFWLDIPAWKFTSKISPTYYNAMDCISTLMLFERLYSEMNAKANTEYDSKLLEAVEQKHNELIPSIFMGYLGLRLDTEERDRLKQEVLAKQQGLRDKMSELFPETSMINLNSPTQLKKLFYSDWNLPPVLKDGKLTASEDAVKSLIRKIKDKSPEKSKWLSLYLEWKELSSIISKELSIEPHPWTQRVHTAFSVVGTESARWSSSAPVWCKKGSKTIGGTNLQNRSKPYRSIYKPAFKDWVFVSADYSGAEARIVAYRCNDEQSKRAFSEGKDIHVLTASLMFGIPEHEVTKELRQIGKTIRHASNYDMSWRKLAQIMEISASQAKDLLERYHTAFPKIRSVFHRKTAEIVQRTRRIQDAWGLPRFFTGRLNDPNTLREAYAFYPQSTCTHTLNKALLELWEWSKDLKWVAVNLQVHDEIVMICKANLDAIRETILRMKSAMEIEIPIWDLEREQVEPLVLPVEFKLGLNWGDMEEFSSVEDALSGAEKFVKRFDKT